LRAASEAYSNAREYAKATELAEAAVKHSPTDPGGQLHLASCYAQSDNENGAIEAAKKAVTLMPGNPMVLSHVATMLSRLDENETAKEYFEKAIKLDAGNAQDHYNLATVKQILGDLKGAEESCDAALALNSKLYETHFVRSRLRKQTTERNHVDELERERLVSGKLPIEQAMVCYALAKEYEDLGEHAKSFASLKEGADTYRRSIEYDVSMDVGQINGIIQTFSSPAAASGEPGYASDAPIFVLGLPRTGTTLVERILASHSDVVSAGELPNLLAQIKKQTFAAFPKTRDKDLFDAALKVAPAEIGKGYVESVPERYRTSQKFVDKLPANFLHTGFIRRSLPNATIVELRRHPMDACYAMYKMFFNRIYPASYDLEDLATYYIEYRKLMDHWHALYPGQITKVNYEDVVADQEAQSRRLMDAAGLPWEDQVLKFYQSKASSATASAAQVRSPVYSSSVQLWRQYENELAPLAEKLDAAGIDIS